VLIEAETIPYEPSTLRGERLLVLAPHPDDEVIGCGGLVALHLRERRQVSVVVVTDGAAGGDAAGREEESRRGLAHLGEGASIEFLRFPDRGLGDEAAGPIRNALATFRPDLVLVPSPIEIHPDHLALSRIFCELMQRDESLAALLAVTNVAFYEVGQPIRPNAIVDITAVARDKYAAIAEHASQLAQRDYGAFTRGLNAYRAMTMPPACTFAEAYRVVPVPALQTTPFSELRSLVGAPAPAEVVSEPKPVSVVVRTKDRPALLNEALASISATGYPCEVIVVNDGGSAGDVDSVVSKALSGNDRVRVIHHASSRGRSAAANAGAEKASGAFLCFLDDDDLFYPEHLEVLTAAAGSAHAGWYGDAVSAFLQPSGDGTYATQKRLRLFAHDFDRELLLLDNYIPLPTLLMPRKSFLDAGGFDPAFDLFEDWEFLLRLTKKGPLLRIPRVTCEVRHFEGGSSIVLAAPEGSPRFRAAKLAVWKKHEAELRPEVIADAFERQKHRLQTLTSTAVEAEGSTAAAHRDLARLEREKQLLIAQGAEAQNAINGHMLRVRELEGAVEVLSDLLERKTGALVTTEKENTRLNGDVVRLSNEVERLNGLLNLIFRSKTWKLHVFLERFRGRG
jgi:LmbE family N-acetylglucosaminyl deacetylase